MAVVFGRVPAGRVVDHRTHLEALRLVAGVTFLSIGHVLLLLFVRREEKFMLEIVAGRGRVEFGESRTQTVQLEFGLLSVGRSHGQRRRVALEHSRVAALTREHVGRVVVDCVAAFHRYRLAFEVNVPRHGEKYSRVEKRQHQQRYHELQKHVSYYVGTFFHFIRPFNETSFHRFAIHHRLLYAK